MTEAPSQSPETAAQAPSYPPGTPMWVDLGSPDLLASRAFYGGLFGWEGHVAPMPEAGGYTMFELDGKMVAGLGLLFNENQPPAWSTYIATDDAAATAQKVRDAGGQVVMEPMQVMDVGHMAVFTDPTGAHFSVWQPELHRGAGLTGAPGSFCWNELATRDMPAAKEFYRRVFGWDNDTNLMGDTGMAYTEFKLDGRSIAGGIVMDDNFPPHVPPHWLVYFTAEDCIAATNKAQELGATIIVQPMKISMGTFSVVSDPQGAVFALMDFKA